MSVSQKHIAIVGFNVPYGSIDPEKFQDEIYNENDPKFRVYMDNMSGKYCMVGIELACDDHGHFDPIDLMSKLEEIVPEKRTIEEDLFVKIPELKVKDPGLFIFSHYS